MSADIRIRHDYRDLDEIPSAHYRNTRQCAVKDAMATVKLGLEEGQVEGASTKAPATGQEGAKPNDGRADCIVNRVQMKSLGI